MNNLKFRAWHPKLEYFIYFGNLEMAHLNKYSLLAEEVDNRTVYHYWDSPTTIQQWTGLKDSSGRDIYVGDIVEFKEEFYMKKILVGGSYPLPRDGKKQTKSEIGEVVFEEITSIDDFYERPTIGLGLKDNGGGVKSLLGKIRDMKPIDYGTWERVFGEYRIVGHNMKKL